MKIDTLEKRIRDLDFAIEKSMRYHQRRRGFYDAWHKVMMFAVIAIAPVLALLLDQPLEVIVLIPAILAALDLVWAPSHRARDHELLFREFSALAIKIRSAAEPDPGQYMGWAAERIRIETGEPPIYIALEADCDNEVKRAWGLDRELVEIDPLSRFTMNLIRHASSTYPSRTNPSPRLQ